VIHQRGMNGYEISDAESHYKILAPAFRAVLNYSLPALLSERQGMPKSSSPLLRRAPLLTSVIVLIGLCASLGLFASTASAAPVAQSSATSSAPRSSVTATPPKTDSPVGVSGAIKCTVNVDNPHKSTHDPSTAGAQGQTTCDGGAVTSLRMSIGLYWSGYLLGTHTEQTNGSTSVAFGYYLACTSGGWQATATTLVTFPPGYTPQTADITDSKVASVTC
jgi:hypothetical protein